MPRQIRLLNKRIQKLERHESLTSLLGIIIMLVFWLTIATFPDFFFFDPTNNADPLRRFSLILSTFGWILISTAAPAIFFLYSSGKSKLFRFLPYCALLWPLSLVVSQLTTFIQSGSFYMTYLFNFPIFVFTDIAIPVIIIAVWFDLKESKDSKSDDLAKLEVSKLVNIEKQSVSLGEGERANDL